MHASAAHRRRTVATVATLIVGLLLAAWLLRGALPEAKAAEPTYQRTVTLTCKTTIDTQFWPTFNASGTATIAGLADGSERIVAVGDFQAWLSDRESGIQVFPTSAFWLTDVYAIDQGAVDHALSESSGKLIDWWVGAKMNALDQTVPVSCGNRLELP